MSRAGYSTNNGSLTGAMTWIEQRSKQGVIHERNSGYLLSVPGDGELSGNILAKYHYTEQHVIEGYNCTITEMRNVTMKRAEKEYEQRVTTFKNEEKLCKLISTTEDRPETDRDCSIALLHNHACSPSRNTNKS